MSGDADATDDTAFLGGRLTLRQFRTGHRAGTDACLLAAAATLPAGGCIVDAGAGVGAVGLAVLCRVPDATAMLIERDPAVAGLARRNVSANGFDRRARVIEADLFDDGALRQANGLGCGDVVLTNPPFYDPATIRASPAGRRTAAHVMERGLGEWLRAAARLAKAKARLLVIHRPDALPVLLGGWPRGWGAFTVQPIHGHADRAAVRVIVSARRGARTPLAVLPPLTLHVPGGGFTPAAEAIHRGAVFTTA